MKANQIFITGLTGNVGQYAAQALLARGAAVKGGVTNIERARSRGVVHKDCECVRFDFLDPATYLPALADVDRIFLMRPPALSRPEQFEPFIRLAKEKGVRHILFLSLLGIEKNPFPPHAKLEKMIIRSGIPYTFLRPSFFMQNMTGAHLQDIRDRNDLFLPAGKAPVSFIDTRDIGEAAANILLEPKMHSGCAYDLTGSEAISYMTAAEIFTRELGRPITYSNPSTLRFRQEKLRQGEQKQFVNVMCALYVMTKLGMAKKVTDDLQRLLGRAPLTFEEFVRDHKSCWQPEPDNG